MPRLFSNKTNFHKQFRVQMCSVILEKVEAMCPQQKLNLESGGGLPN